ncbi:MAG: alpha/beta hydrolase-fold protein [Thermoplasmata archaeon]
MRRKAPDALPRFWAEMERKGTPLIEKRSGARRDFWVTFLWRGRGFRNVGFRAMLGGDIASLTELARLPGTDVWYRTYPVRDDLREMYQFALNEPWRPARNTKEEEQWESRRVADPRNPRRLLYPEDPDFPDDPIKGSRTAFSLVQLPRAPRHRELLPRRGVEAGRLEEHVVTSRSLKEKRRIWVHVPAGVEPGQSGLHVAVFFDGFAYAHSMSVPTTLDNLVASGRIAPVLSVFIDQLKTRVERRRDLCQSSPAFGKFLVQEVLPWLRRTYRIHVHPDRTMLVGLSCGGLAALYWAAENPKHFRLVLSQSGSFQINRPPDEEPGSLIRSMMKRPLLPLRIYMEAGLIEGNYVIPGGMTLLAANRHMRDVLQLKGYRLTYREFNGSHNFESWRESLVDGLVDLLGTHPESRRP